MSVLVGLGGRRSDWAGEGTRGEGGMGFGGLGIGVWGIGVG